MHGPRRSVSFVRVCSVIGLVAVGIGCGSVEEEERSEAAVEHVVMEEVELAEGRSMSSVDEAVAGMGTEVESVPEEEGVALPSGPVRGTVAGVPWVMDSIQRTGPGMFTMRSDGGEDRDTLLFFFFFPGDGELIEGSSYSFDLSDEMHGPHIHVHYNDPETGEREVEVFMKGYGVDVRFGERGADGSAPSTIRFEVPELDLSIEGAFDLPAQ